MIKQKKNVPKKQSIANKPKRTTKRRGKKTTANEEVYLLKKNTGLKVARIFLWGILIFFFAMGVVQIFKPDDAQAVNSTIQNFETEFASYKGENEEIMAFVQNFTKEYLTYDAEEGKGKNNYKDRLRPYISSNIYNMSDLTDFKSDAKAVYVQAYRKEQYSANQYDVYVLAEVEYEVKTEGHQPEGTVSGNSSKEIVTAQTILKVPVYAENGSYVVEDIPVFTSDSILFPKYVMNDYIGTPVSDVTLSNINGALTNFFQAYYDDSQSVIEYYLSKDANKSKFTGLYGRYSYESIESLCAYQEVGQADTTCIVKIKIKDNANEALLFQEFNLQVIAEGDKYYIEDMDTRTGNLTISNY